MARPAMPVSDMRSKDADIECDGRRDRLIQAMASSYEGELDVNYTDEAGIVCATWCR